MKAATSTGLTTGPLGWSKFQLDKRSHGKSWKMTYSLTGKYIFIYLRGSMGRKVYLPAFTIKINQMLVDILIYHTWILWDTSFIKYLLLSSFIHSATVMLKLISIIYFPEAQLCVPKNVEKSQQIKGCFPSIYIFPRGMSVEVIFSCENNLSWCFSLSQCHEFTSCVARHPRQALSPCQTRCPHPGFFLLEMRSGISYYWRSLMQVTEIPSLLMITYPRRKRKIINFTSAGEKDRGDVIVPSSLIGISLHTDPSNSDLEAFINLMGQQNQPRPIG